MLVYLLYYNASKIFGVAMKLGKNLVKLSFDLASVTRVCVYTFLFNIIPVLNILITSSLCSG